MRSQHSRHCFHLVSELSSIELPIAVQITKLPRLWRAVQRAGLFACSADYHRNWYCEAMNVSIRSIAFERGSSLSHSSETAVHYTGPWNLTAEAMTQEHFPAKSSPSARSRGLHSKDAGGYIEAQSSQHDYGKVSQAHRSSLPAKSELRRDSGYVSQSSATSDSETTRSRYTASSVSVLEDNVLLTVQETPESKSNNAEREPCAPSYHAMPDLCPPLHHQAAAPGAEVQSPLTIVPEVDVKTSHSLSTQRARKPAQIRSTGSSPDDPIEKISIWVFGIRKSLRTQRITHSNELETQNKIMRRVTNKLAEVNCELAEVERSGELRRHVSRTGQHTGYVFMICARTTERFVREIRKAVNQIDMCDIVTELVSILHAAH